MSETPNWTDIVVDTTVEIVSKKDILMNTTGHEKVTVMIGICLAAKENGAKMKLR